MRNLILVLFALLAMSIGLAFGLGAKDHAASILVRNYIHSKYLPGTKIKSDLFEGEVIECDALNTTLRSSSGLLTIVPNKAISNAIVSIVSKNNNADNQPE